MSVSIEKEFNAGSLLMFSLPSIIMLVFMSLYTIVDGIFISHFVGDNGLSATNISYPAISVIIAIGVMLGTGGCAAVAKQMGEGKIDMARRSFSFLIAAGIVLGILCMVIGNVWLTPLLHLMGATDILLGYCQDYLSILLYFAPACILQLMFQSFFVAAGKPNIGLITTIAGGVTNAVLDYLLMGPMHMGISGAALATGMGQLIPSLTGIVFFIFYRKDLYFVRFGFYKKLLLQSCLNGSSEMVANMATAVVTLLFNIVMLRLAGETGVAAITILFYGQFVFNALYLGYSMGVAPVISFNYGKQNYRRLLRLFHICVAFIMISSAVITIIALVSSPFVIEAFVSSDSETYHMAFRGFIIFAFNFLFAGINIFSSSFYTALSDGKTSAFISFLRTFGFLTGCILILPMILGTDGVWLSVPIAEFLTMFIAVYKLKHFSKHAKEMLRTE